MNTGVGCHFLLQCMKVKSESEVTQSCPTLSDIVDCSPPGSSVHGIFQAKVLGWGAIAFSGPQHRTKQTSGKCCFGKKDGGRKELHWCNTIGIVLIFNLDGRAVYQFYCNAS